MCSSTAPTVRLGEGREAYGDPPIRAEPEDGRTRPRIIRNVVVFPAPLGPRKAVMRPGRTSKESERTAWTGPKDLLSARTEIGTMRQA